MHQDVHVSFQQLLKALLDQDSTFPAHYLYRFSDIEPKELNNLAQIWSEVPLWRRRALMEDIEQLGERDTLLSFETLGRFAVGDTDSIVRLLAVRTLFEYEAHDLIDIFIERVKVDEDVDVRAAAAAGLGRFVYAGELDQIPRARCREIEECLLGVMRSAEAPHVRRRALESLGYSSRTEVVGLIETAYASDDDDWIASSLFAISRSANNRWQQQVLSMLGNDHPQVRSAAIRAAGELGIREAVPFLLEILYDEDDDIRAAGMWALSQIGGEGVRDSLEDLYEELDDEGMLDLLDDALDNLAFTEDMPIMSIFDFEDNEGDDEDMDYAEDEDEWD